MKKIFYVLGIFLIYAQYVNCQITLTIQPDGETGKDAMVHSHPNYVNSNFGSTSQFPAAAWSAGSDFIARSLIEFDLSSIPNEAIINSAFLSLFAIDPTTAAGGMGQHDGTLNGCYIQRITSTWDENTVTWNTQPTTTDVNQVSLSPTISPTQNFENINVKALIQDIINDRQNSFGFMLKLQNEIQYNRVNFSSSDHTDEALRPKLVITYTLPDHYILILQPDGSTGKDALLHGHPSYVDTNMGNATQFVAAQATAGAEFTARSIIAFDLSSIPSNGIIDSARLSLSAIDLTTANGGMGLHMGENACWIERIISNWEENTVTWNTQPATSNIDRVATPKLTDTNAGISVDVKNLVQDMVINPGISFGFMLKLQSEVKWSLVNFASSDHAEESRRPKLAVYYSIPLAIAKNDLSKIIQITPNPTLGKFIVEIKNPTNSQLLIYSISGKLIKHLRFVQCQNYIDLSGYPKGLYLIKIKTGNQIETKKIILD